MRPIRRGSTSSVGALLPSCCPPKMHRDIVLARRATGTARVNRDDGGRALQPSIGRRAQGSADSWATRRLTGDGCHEELRERPDAEEHRDEKHRRAKLRRDHRTHGTGKEQNARERDGEEDVAVRRRIRPLTSVERACGLGLVVQCLVGTRGFVTRRIERRRSVLEATAVPPALERRAKFRTKMRFVECAKMLLVVGVRLEPTGEERDIDQAAPGYLVVRLRRLPSQYGRAGVIRGLNAAPHRRLIAAPRRRQGGDGQQDRGAVVAIPVQTRMRSDRFPNAAETHELFSVKAIDVTLHGEWLDDARTQWGLGLMLTWSPLRA